MIPPVVHKVPQVAHKSGKLQYLNQGCSPKPNIIFAKEMTTEPLKQGWANSVLEGLCPAGLLQP